MLFARMVADVDCRFPRARPTPTERRILAALLGWDGITDARLASSLGVDRSHLSRVLKQLIADGVVTHRPSPNHRSQRLLSLSEAGLLQAQDLDAAWTAALQAQFDGLSPSDQRLVIAAMGAGSYSDEIGNRFGIEYRQLAPEDLGWMLTQAPRLDSDPEHLTWTAAVIANFLASKSYATFGAAARYGVETVGACMILPNPDNDLHARVSYLFVAERFRGRDIEKKLLGMCIDHAREKELLGLSAEARADEHDRDDLFRGLGFKRRREKIPRQREGMPVYYRRYELRQPF